MELYNVMKNDNKDISIDILGLLTNSFVNAVFDIVIKYNS